MFEFVERKGTLIATGRGRANALILQGQSQRDVAQQFGVHESTISRLVQRLRATGRLTDRPRSGRPRVTTQRQDRRIRLVHLRNDPHSGSVVERPLCDREVASSIPGRVIPKTLKMILSALSLGAQH